MEHFKEQDAYGLETNEIDVKQCSELAQVLAFDVPGTAWAEKEGMDGCMLFLQDKTDALKNDRTHFKHLIDSIIKWGKIAEGSELYSASAACSAYIGLKKTHPEIVDSPESEDKYKMACEVYDEAIKEVLDIANEFMQQKGQSDESETGAKS